MIPIYSKMRLLKLSVLAMALAIGASVAMAGEHKNNLSIAFEDSFWGQQAITAQRIVAAMEYSTGGAVGFTMYPNGEKGAASVVLEGLQLGTIDMTISSVSKLAQFTKALTAVDVPFMFKDPTTLLNLVFKSDSELTPLLESKLEEASKAANFKILAVILAGRRDAVFTKPTTSIDQALGRKMRLMANKVHMAAWDELGLNTMSLPWSELYTSLQTGVVDVAEMTPNDYLQGRFAEVAPYWIGTNHINYMTYVAISNKAWDSLPTRYQNELKNVVVRTAYLDSYLSLGISKALLGLIEKSAKKMTYLSEDEALKLRRTVLPALLDKYKGDIGMDLIAKLAEDDTVVNEWYDKNK